MLLSWGAGGVLLYVDFELRNARPTAVANFDLNDSPITFGSLLDLGSPQYFFNGSFDNIALYGSQITPFQAEALVECVFTVGCDTTVVPLINETIPATTPATPYNSSVPDLIAYWSFNDTVLPVALEIVQGYNGSYVGEPILESPVCLAF